MDQDLFEQKPAPRKLRFKPKPQKHRTTKPVAPKIEVTEDAEAAEAKELLQRLQDGLAAKPKVEKKVEPVRVTFGSGSAIPSDQYNGSFFSKPARSTLKEEKEYKEPWNYYSYYPTTLPLRRPYSGKPDVLDNEEFVQASAYDERKVNLAMGLGLMEESSDSRMLFFKLPKALPMIKPTASAEGEASGSNPKPPRAERPCGINELKSGFMGKMLVYKSGAVKLKLGDTIYDVTPGSDCGFAQDVVAVDVGKKNMCAVGEISKHVVVTPDVHSILDSVAG